MFKNKIINNASWIIACRIVQSALALIINMLTARYLGPSNFGVISYAASIVAFFVPVMQLGLSNILVQETVQHPEEEGKIYGSAIVMSICSSVACMIGITTFVSVAHAGETETVITCALYSILLLCQAVELMQYWYQAKYLSKYMSIVSLCAYVIVSAYKIFLLVTQKSVYWFAVSNAIDYFLISMVLLVIYKKLGGARLSFSWSVSKRMLSSSKHYIIPGLMVVIFAQTDKIMLTLMVNETVTGYYSAAVASAAITNFIFAAIIDSARPAIFESKKKDQKDFEKNVSRLYSVITYLSLAQCIGMTVLAKPIILVMYGEAYYPAIAALRLIVWYTTFAYFGAIRNIWMLAEEKQKYLLPINLAGALANVLLNAVLIPFMGMMGAALASLVTQFFTNVIVGFILTPIRKNNFLMIKGLNISCILKMIRMKG